jgi:hypothetical protein
MLLLQGSERSRSLSLYNHRERTTFARVEQMGPSPVRFFAPGAARRAARSPKSQESVLQVSAVQAYLDRLAT